MKAVSKFSLSFLAALLLACAAQVHAQVAVYDFYTSDIVLHTFNLIDGSDNVIPSNNFITPLSYYNQNPQTDFDNGVAFDIPFPVNFTFIYNGIGYNKLNVAVNGWVNFGQVPLDTRDPQLLFNANLPNATVAPFFGDHYLRPDATQGFTQSRISTATAQDPDHPGMRIFIVQWENLNINYLTAPDPKQSVATFQVWFYEYSTLQTGRGNIEFHYGNIGHGTVQTSGATVGIEDENGLSFMNGLFTTTSDPLDSVRHSFLRTGNWPPSRQPGRVIQFSPFGYIVNHWGDGDADLSQIQSPPPAPIATPIDALTILRSRVNNYPLDSVFGRSAFHADVNHNGRFTYDLQGQKHVDTSRGTTGLPSDGHPNDVVYFQATAFDAALILLYDAGKLPYLPWLVDTIPPFGKLPTNIPTALTFGNSATEQTSQSIVVPIMMQGVGAMSAEFSLAYDPTALQLVGVTGSTEGNMNLMANGSKIAVAGVGEFSNPTIVGYARFNVLNGAAVQTIGATNVSVNDVMSKDISTTVGAPATSGLFGAYPDPFSTAFGSTQIFYNTNTDGLVTLKVYDVLGNVVRTLVASEQTHGSYTVSFDGRDANSRLLPSGTYFYRLDANGTSSTKQLVIYNGLK